mgnify:CR=1 FL=1
MADPLLTHHLNLEQALSLAAQGLGLLLESLSVATVLIGLLVTLRQGLSRWRSRPRTGTPLMALRIGFGNWLSLALEFQLGADIVATTASPDAQNLLRLSVVAIIRTLLNVFLAREMESHERLQQHGS